MIDFYLGSSFWKWWTNPVLGLHPDHHWMLPLAYSPSTPLSYAELLQFRDRLGLHDAPEPLVTASAPLLALCWAEADQLDQHLYPLIAMTLGQTVLQTRPEKWAEVYGIHQPHQIRDIVRTWTHFHEPLRVWQAECAEYFQPFDEHPIPYELRLRIALGVCLQSICPKYYQRWMWTVDAKTQGHVTHFARCAPHLEGFVQAWLLELLAPVSQAVSSAIAAPEVAVDEEGWPVWDDEQWVQGAVNHE